ncbi:MAG: aminotransferase class III-fold pyridoxal phosphate-dependent enzyme [Actinomycetia bacterium]|nr:aminotransferase class III-fold pyridoxal phosphate-dependent enzyme [Actinomycetes bacterium]
MSNSESLRGEVEALYRERTPGSRALWEEGSGILPMGVSGAAKFYDPYPVVLATGAGGHVTDVDGHDYVDFLMGAGSSLLGHSHPQVAAAVREQIGRLATVMAPTPIEQRFAERLRGMMPYLERIRFANTGSEAVRTALRAARAATGKTLYGKFEGNYHGSDDYFLVSSGSRQVAGPPHRPQPVFDSAGVPDRIADEVLLLPYNDAENAAALIAEHAEDLAAVVMEPVAFSTGGGVAADRHFAKAVREATSRHGIVLIFDEVVTGLRLGTAGAPGYLGVTPDLACLGKAIGGGLPLSALGGRADIMEEVLGPDSISKGTRIFHSGTFTGNPVSLAAGMAVFDILDREPVLEHIDLLGARLMATLQEVLDSHGMGQMTGFGSIFQLHFTAAPPRNRREILAGDHDLLSAVLLGMCAHGILWPPVHPGVVSYGHTESDIDRSATALDAVLGMAA